MLKVEMMNLPYHIKNMLNLGAYRFNENSEFDLVGPGHRTKKRQEVP